MTTTSHIIAHLVNPRTGHESWYPLVYIHQTAAKPGYQEARTPTFRKYPFWSQLFASESAKTRHFMIEKTKIPHRILDSAVFGSLPGPHFEIAPVRCTCIYPKFRNSRSNEWHIQSTPCPRKKEATFNFWHTFAICWDIFFTIFVQE